MIIILSNFRFTKKYNRKYLSSFFSDTIFFKNLTEKYLSIDSEFMIFIFQNILWCKNKMKVYLLLFYNHFVMNNDKESKIFLLTDTFSNIFTLSKWLFEWFLFYIDIQLLNNEIRWNRKWQKVRSIKKSAHEYDTIPFATIINLCCIRSDQ